MLCIAILRRPTCTENERLKNIFKANCKLYFLSNKIDFKNGKIRKEGHYTMIG